ncbi:MAG: flagellar assembly protein FliW [Campylobacterota bacterium]|nr:flagellar assembly protein FliW [Campylobacterota bacterium]
MKFDLIAPLLGFPEVKQVELEKIDDIFMKMVSLEDANISFTLIDPFALRDYDFEVPTNLKELLEIDENSNMIILNIVLIQTPIENSVVNFIGPLIFNTDNKKVAQVILSESTKYTVAEKISIFFNR